MSYLSFVVDTIQQNKPTGREKVRLRVDRTDNVLREESYTENDGENIRKSTWYVLGSVGEIGFVIAIPIVLGVLGGEWLDKKFSMYPKMTMSGLGGGLIIGFLGAYSTIMDIIKKK